MRCASNESCRRTDCGITLNGRRLVLVKCAAKLTLFTVRDSRDHSNASLRRLELPLCGEVYNWSKHFQQLVPFGLYFSEQKC